MIAAIEDFDDARVLLRLICRQHGVPTCVARYLAVFLSPIVYFGIETTEGAEGEMLVRSHKTWWWDGAWVATYRRSDRRAIFWQTAADVILGQCTLWAQWNAPDELVRRVLNDAPLCCMRRNE